MLDLTISIVNFDTKEIILRCLESIFKYTTNLSFEVIVVDNGSKDNSTERIRENFPHVILVENRHNIGFAKAHNLSFRLSKGRYFAVLNSDIIITANVFKKLIDFMDFNSDVALVSPKVYYPDGRVQEVIDYSPSIYDIILKTMYRFKILKKSSSKYSVKNFNYDLPKYIDEKEYIMGCCFVVRKSYISNQILFDERFSPVYFEDTDLVTRLIKDGYKVVYYPHCSVIHYHGYTVYKKRNENFENWIKIRVIYRLNRYKYFRKHKGFGAELIVRMVDFLESILLLIWRFPKWLVSRSTYDKVYLKIDSTVLLASLGLINPNKYTL